MSAAKTSNEKRGERGGAHHLTHAGSADRLRHTGEHEELAEEAGIVRVLEAGHDDHRGAHEKSLRPEDHSPTRKAHAPTSTHRGMCHASTRSRWSRVRQKK